MKQVLQQVLVGCLLSTPLYAGMMQDKISDMASRQWLGQVSLGAAWSQPGGDAQTFYLNPTIEKGYHPTTNSKGMPNVEVFLGTQKSLDTPALGQVSGQLGLVVATTGNANMNGVIWDNAEPQFNNYSYNYQVRNTRIGLKGKALLEKNKKIFPYVSGSVNVGFNRASDFTNTPLTFTALLNENFAGNTETAFTYTVGAGLQTPLSCHIHAGVGYEFLDFGKSKLDRAPGQTMNSGLASNHLYTHGVLANLTYMS
ncbi:MAG: porin family protein [Legionellaceae bacterium]|nr:porin family protein [Legionellaceae bacterium]